MRLIVNLKKGLITLSLLGLITLAMLPLNVVEAQDVTLFKVTIIAPGNANMVRRQWGEMFANSLRQLGIDARVVFLGWTGVFDRVLTPPLDIVGKTWDEGGYDIQLVGWAPGLLPEPRQLYYGGDPAFFAPTGQNYPLWNNSEANALLDTFITSTDPDVQIQSLQAWQSLFYNEVPASQIFYSSTPAVVTPELGGPALSDTVTGSGEGWLYFNVQVDPEWLTGKTEVVYASTGEIESLIPPLSKSWYDTIINSAIFNGLAEVAPDLSDLAIPALLTGWTASENGFKWTWTCRSGVKWHDGEDFSADDVVFSLWALMNADAGSQFKRYYQSVYGDNVKFTYTDASSTTLGTGTRVGNITAVNATTVEVWLPELALDKPYGYFDPYLLTFANNIIPKHIFENMDPLAWTDSPFNTGVGAITIDGTTYTGPIGTGPYKWEEYDAVNQLVHLEKFADYWDKTALEASGLFGVTDYYIRFIADKTPALAALKNDEVDMLDPNYQMQIDIPTIDPAWGKVLLQEGAGRQEIGYNMRHPIFGTGVDTPLGQSAPSRAAEAARYVRTAFDYAVPRHLIIDNLLGGFGQPGATPILPTQPYYNSAISPRPYDLSKAAEYLEKAGYTVPPPPAPPEYEFFVGMSLSIRGTYTDPGAGGIIPNRELELRETTDNETFETVAITTTDYAGRYFFTATPDEEGTYYYWLYDRQFAAVSDVYNGTYLRSLTVSSFSDACTSVVNATLVSINGTIATIKTDLGMLEVKLDILNATIVTIEGKMVAIETDMGVIRADLDTIDAKLALLNNTVATIQTGMGTIETDISNVQLRVTTINGTTATMQTTLGTIEGRITSIEENMVTIETDIGTIWTILEEWTGETSSPISTPLGDFQILVLTTSTLEGPIEFYDNTLTLNVSGPSGTVGKTNVVIPEQLLAGIESSIDKVFVTIDNEQVLFSYTEQAEAYVLQIICTHSEHTIKVYLAGLPPTPFQAWVIAILVLIVAVATGAAFYILKIRKPRIASDTKSSQTYLTAQP
ncbi:MAG: ABC transporter substrate-binding protein [Candidatus Bathyarchaeota archaeon]|nr:ABC transporter substrate-binding protein [Candidatus Bathyarchaeota archaeon]